MPYVPSNISSRLLREATQYKIDGYQRLFYLKDAKQLKIQTVKKSLAEGNPVVIGMRCPPSFEKADGQAVWNPKEGPKTPYFFGHAMCVIGYDNQKYGGAFEIMNSWGSRWGNNGFIWVRYRDFADFAKYAYVLQLSKAASQSKGKAYSYSSKSPRSRQERPRTYNTANISNKPSSTHFYVKGRDAANRYVDLGAQVKLRLEKGEEMDCRLYGNYYRTKKKLSGWYSI